MKPEPKPRSDGKCVVCKKKITIIPRIDHDAFCSTVCCREYFGTTSLITTSTSKPS